MKQVLIFSALLGLSAPALAQTRALPPGEIRANGDITFGNALKLGKREGNKTVITPDTLQILGPGSTGDVSGMSVPALGRPAQPSLSTILGRRIEVADFRLPADGTDWGPAFNRARLALVAAGGGVLNVSTPGTLTIATQVAFPKGAPPILLRCESSATVLTNAASLTSPMFSVGGSTPEGAAGFDAEGCAFTGANTTSSFAFGLQNANAVTFSNLSFTGLTTAITSASGFAITMRGTVSLNVGTTFYSSTAAHNFVADRIKVYNGGAAIYFVGATDNATIQNSDFEFPSGPTVRFDNGGTSLRYVGNYTEYFGGDPIFSAAPLYGSDISNNWIALGSPWSAINMVGGQFKGNSIYNQIIAWGSGTVDMEVGDNRVTGTGSVQPSPYQVPPLTNSWTQQANHSPVGFRKGRDGKVYLRGNLLKATAGLGISAFTLPAGYRPGSQRTFVTANSGGALSRVGINGDGQVVINAASGAGTSGDPYQAGLDGISFEPGT